MNKVCGNKTDFDLIREDTSRIIFSYSYKAIDDNLGEWYEVYVYKKQFNQIAANITIPADEEGFDMMTAIAKEMLVQLQKEYDKSDEVNCFLFGGEKAWLDKDTRVGLVNSCDVREKKGHDDYTVYFNGQPVTLPITLIRQILDDVEDYAMSCYAVTEQHLAEIAALATRKDILEYDITQGYPSKLEFTPNNV